MIKIIFSICLAVIILSTSNAQWQTVGNPGFLAGYSYQSSLCISPADEPYVALVDSTKGLKATVMKFNGSNWEYVGIPGFSHFAITDPTLKFSGDGDLYIAFRSMGYSGKATVMKFDGTNWEYVGSPGFSFGEAYYLSFDISDTGALYVAYREDYYYDKATVKKFDGNDWVTVGPAEFSAGGVEYTRIAIKPSGEPYVAYRDLAKSNKATVKKFNGITWQNVGTEGFTNAAVEKIDITFTPLGEPIVAFNDHEYSGKATVKKYTGVNWVTIGNPGFNVGQGAMDVNIAVSSTGEIYTAFFGSLNSANRIIVMRFNGNTWVPVGDPQTYRAANSASLALSHSDLPYIAFQEFTENLHVTVMKFGGDTCIVNIPDPNLKAYLVGNTNINLNGDNEIQCLEAASYTGQLNCPSMNISDFTGIEAFTAVTIIRCNNNNLTTLDLSNHLALKELHCQSNQLTNLDVTNNLALNILNCSSNQLNNLDVTNNTALTHLTIYNNAIMDLDLSNNLNLKELLCSMNQLSNLDISNNTALQTLHCYNNQLTDLNLNNNSALRDVYCYNNQLTNLDLSSNPSLKNLFAYNNQLTSLNVANGSNQLITAINTSGNLNLSCIQVDNAAFSYSNWTNGNFNFNPGYSFNEYCGPCIVSIPDVNFKTYLLGNNEINTNGDTEIQCSEAEAFTGIINCSSLNISNLTGIEAFTSLSGLNCSNNQISTIVLSSNIALLSLNCSNNQLSSLSLTQNTSLNELDCSNNQIYGLEVTFNSALTNLICSSNHILNLNLTNNPSLTKLNCMGNQLTNMDLSQNSALISLNCSNNQLSNLNVSNGNNASITQFSTLHNPNLTCIQVDDATYSMTNWIGGNFSFDQDVAFNENCLTVDIHDMNPFEIFSVYPNPANSVINIETSTPLTIEILDVLGKKVDVMELKNQNNTVDVSRLTTGIYFISHITTAGKKDVIKFIKL